ncbi:Tetratricopeptide repeat-containing protein [Dehalogenimonas formicexedens]|uniref:Tetratricopeptide repeat-containing protein n=1 Tax=Dehalogenimonas formicexedens TaxID=1839801 RepID=A0A1P8F4I2_9CHLR|nr:tetratricopeptide repeat protein [Dehalogenimonas formicexedens]APV43384.1 Tetratricopeptide repeat-containing protein [Dehalogenimonas formicexedens]
MAYNDDEQAKLKKQHSQSAIDLALSGRWRDAIAANQAILELFPQDIEALNRLGRAHMELGEYAEAQASYKKAKEADPYNSIADRNLRRLEVLLVSGSKTNVEANSQRVEPQVFLEETGKAGVINLSSLAPREVLAHAVAGDKVNLLPAGASIRVETMAGEYVGSVEPRHALRLLKLMRGGNRYSGTVVSSTEDKLSVMIRETYQDPSQVGQISFPTRLPTAARKPELESAAEETEPAPEGEEAEAVVEENLEEETYPEEEDEEELEV